jgi:hypothetical protein
MDATNTIFPALIGIGLLIGATSVIRGWLAKARLNGMKKVADAMIRGISHHYEQQDEPLPPEVDKAIDELNALVARQKDDRGRAEQYAIGARILADAMGQACVSRGFQSGQHWSEPTGGDTRVDLSEKELLNLAFLAHMGFEKMIGWGGSELEFDDEQDAERASEAIRQLERHKPKDAIDESDPYALAFDRQTMIWRRWPRNTTEGVQT